MKINPVFGFHEDQVNLVDLLCSCTLRWALFELLKCILVWYEQYHPSFHQCKNLFATTEP